MSSPSLSSLVWLIGGIATLGLLLVKVGRWPRRRGGEQRCRRCAYVVDNISSERCPECGSILAGRGTVRGQRRRRAWLWGPGLLLFLIAVGWGGHEAYLRVDWYHYKPTRWVMSDLKVRDGVTEEKAWLELLRREESGGLETYWQEKLADVALADDWAWSSQPASVLQAVTSIQRGQKSRMFLWDQLEAAKLKPAHVEQFFKQMANTVPFQVRRVVLVGQEVPYRVSREDSSNEFPNGRWWMRVGLVGGNIDDELVKEGDFPFSGHLSPTLPESARKAPGVYDIPIRYFVAFYHSAYGSDEEARKQTPAWRGEFVQFKKVKVVAQRSDEFMKLVDAPELAEQIKRHIHIKNFSIDVNTSRYELTMNCSRPPINIAFDIFARVNGREQLLTSLTFSSGDSWVSTNYDFGDFRDKSITNKLDLIFRTNAQHAEDTVDILHVWKGELIYKDFPITDSKHK